jgi:hypothetical protein
LGLEYPIGSLIEHIGAAGVWVGGILDTSTGPSPAFVRRVSVAFEGWAGPWKEFFPGPSPADSIWKVTGRGIPRPASWESYWGNTVPSVSFSDNDHYCRYDDYHVNVAGHVPLRLRIVESSFVWDNPYAEAVDIIEYRIINQGVKQIDSAYIGFLLDADVGPYHVPLYWDHNYTGYYPSTHTAYIHNPVDIGSTPVGVSVLSSPRPLDSVRFAFRGLSGAQTPATDAAKYALLSSGIIQPDEFPGLSETRCVLSFGPFVLYPSAHPLHDTLVAALAIVSGQSLPAMQLHAQRAKAIYLNGGQVSVDPPETRIPDQFELLQNYPNPFNPATTIRFALPRSGFATLTIANTLGEVVAMPVSQQLSAGVHSVVWDATGKASGVYFSTLRLGEYVATRKLILLR